MMRLFHDKPFSPQITIDGRALNHLHVRRIQQNSDVQLMNGRGHIAIYKVVTISKKIAHLEQISITNHPPVKTPCLLVSLCRIKAMEAVCQKACELGISEIQPVITDHVGTSLSDEQWQVKRVRLSEIMQQSLLQCGNPYLPQIAHLVLLSDIDPTSYIVADAGGDSSESTNQGSKSILIGPEGGFSEQEYLYFQHHKIKKIKLPGWTLRAETAAILAMGLIVKNLVNN